jgi:hypothetical protein
MDVVGAPESYCREVEAYLCRKNDGHLVRIVGPAFERVSDWAARGVPLAAVFRGIDRHFERYYAKGPRRRPVRVEFCEADVLDVFDEWRRAVGIATATAAADVDEGAAEGGGRRTSLPAHLERVVARLTAARVSAAPSLDALVNDMIREIDAARAGARGLRGAARESLLCRLRVLDEQLVAAARAACDGAVLQQLGEEADAELAPFRTRLSPDGYARAREACIDRLVRARAKLPVVALE